MPDEEEINVACVNELIKNGISEALHKIDPTEMVIEFAAVIVSIDGEGRRNMWVCGDEAQGLWTDMGLFQYGLSDRQAQLNAYRTQQFLALPPSDQ